MIDWNKGKAVEFLLESLGIHSSLSFLIKSNKTQLLFSNIWLCYYLIGAGLSNRNDVLPIYIGDDRTDEDAFKVKHHCDSIP